VAPNGPLTDARAAAGGTGLARVVPRWQIVPLAVGDVIGSGIYLLPAAAAALLGPISILAVVAAGLVVTLLVLCFAEASSHFDQPGGAYLYTREAFGPFVGFEVGWMTWLTRVATLASVANGFALAATFVWPGAAEGFARVLLVAGPVLLLALIHARGVHVGVGVSVGLVFLKLLPLLLFIGAGLFALDPTLLRASTAPPPRAFGEAALLLLFAYGGFENTCVAAGEFRDPKRDVPFALVVMIVTVTAIYGLVQLVALGTHPELARSASPLAEAAARFLGGAGGVLLTLGAMVSILGLESNTTLNGPRYVFALARDGYGPRALARVHPRWRTPAAAIAFQTAVVLALAFSGSFVQLALLSVVARLATYAGTAAAVPRLRRRFGDSGQGVRLPGGSLIPRAALVLCVVLVLSTRPANLLAGAVALLVGALVYRTRRREAT
jgi:amino acid transporter